MPCIAIGRIVVDVIADGREVDLTTGVVIAKTPETRFVSLGVTVATNLLANATDSTPQVDQEMIDEKSDLIDAMTVRKKDMKTVVKLVAKEMTTGDELIIHLWLWDFFLFLRRRFVAAIFDAFSVISSSLVLDS